jgi:hypothetical protein
MVVTDETSQELISWLKEYAWLKTLAIFVTLETSQSATFGFAFEV